MLWSKVDQTASARQAVTTVETEKTSGSVPGHPEDLAGLHLVGAQRVQLQDLLDDLPGVRVRVVRLGQRPQALPRPDLDLGDRRARRPWPARGPGMPERLGRAREG